MKLEERICACGCRKQFRCLPTSQTLYSSLHCMEAAGALPPTDKFGRTTKSAARPAGATAKPVVAQNAEAESEDEDSDEIPMLMEEDDTLEADGDEELLEHHEDSDSKNPPEIDPAA